LKRMETEAPSGPGRYFLLSLGVIGILLGVLVGAELAVPLQPRIAGPTVQGAAGVASVVMPVYAAVLNFSPVNITVYVGYNNTVQWTNEDTIQHTVKSTNVPAGAAAFESGILSQGDTFKVTLNKTGTYDYFCTIHPGTMRGSIIVKQAAIVTIPAGTANEELDYLPASVSVVMGTNNTVLFVNQDSTKHTVTADGGGFDSKDILPGMAWAYTFASPGTYAYHCIYHSFMKGVVFVKSP
jgi:plastocyanin